ncbi:MAG: polyphosphate kinase 1 [Bacteroidetes bacterium]|nr:polyphosphate kinase 1 [Bacteroidota bacterium]
MLRKEKRLINRELSWLSFNARVLQEAADPRVPLLERLRFLGIFSNNQDEFFRVRVATNRRMLLVKKGDFDTIANKDEIKKTLQLVQREVVSLQKEYDNIFYNLIEELKRQRIFWIDEKKLNQLQEQEVKRYFKEEILSHLFPVLLDENKDIPHLKDSAIYLAVRMTKRKTAQTHYAIVEIPTKTKDRFYLLPTQQDGNRYILFLDDVIRANLRLLFSIFDYDNYEAYTVKITRDAELDIELAVSENMYDKIKRALKLRNQGELVRFVYDKEMPKEMLRFFLNKLGLSKESTLPGQRYHNFKDLMKFPVPKGLNELLYKPFEQLTIQDFESSGNLFEKISRKDYLLTHPYQSFDYVIRFLRESALDPNVDTIKIALYRVAEYSNVVNALINAAKNGKRVFVMMELKARFDEESNIYWSKKLIESGAKVFYGYERLKVHAKTCLVYRKENNQTKLYAHIGSGNYNAVTAKYYVDHALFTSDTRITTELDGVFNAIENYEEYKPEFKYLLVSPYNTRSSIIEKIDREIQHIRIGKPAWIRFKLNNLTDPSVIEKLYEASQKGVKIELIVRGICCLIPQVKGLSENIQAISIVDRFLEHSRLYIFCNDNRSEYYFGSADLMQRNLDNRIEVITPVFDETLQNELNRFFEIQWRDNVKARIIDASQHNEYRIPFEPKIRSQEKVFGLLGK